MSNSAADCKDICNLRGIDFGSLNIRSLSRKIDEVKFLLKETDLNFLALNEIWLNNSISDCELEIPHYQMIRFDRDLGSGKRGGGGLISYTHLKYQFENLPNWNLCCPGLEWQWIVLKHPKTRRTYICNIYRPPDGKVDTALDLIDNRINDIYTEGVSDVLIMVDLNIDLLQSNDPKSCKLKTLIKTCSLTQQINGPTRITPQH